MPFISKPLTWLDLNDIALLYEDGGVSADDLRGLFKVGKRRILRSLRLMGVTVRARATCPTVVGDGEETYRMRSKAQASALRRVRSLVRAHDPRAHVVKTGRRPTVTLAFSSMKAARGFLGRVLPYVPLDEDPESLSSSVAGSWTGRINFDCSASDDGSTKWSVRPSVTVPTRDLERIASILSAE